MKIDLHCHTKSTKKGDGGNRTVEPDLFARKIEQANVEIVAITNHNQFDKEQFTLLGKSVEGTCELWPGVELDMAGEANDWHMLVVCNPKQLDEFDTTIKGLVGEIHPDEAKFSIDDIANVILPLDVLYIPHSLGKRSGKTARSIPDKEKLELESKLGIKERIIYEPHHFSLGVLSRNGYRVVVGSDVKEWDKYELCETTDIRLQIPSFGAFCKLVEGNKEYYNSVVLGEDKRTRLLVSPVEGATERMIDIYKGTNIIFGQKGTGKSKLIEGVDKALRDMGKESKLYKTREARDIYESELVPDRNLCSCSLFGIDNCSDDFASIISWTEKPIPGVNAYIDYQKDTSASKNRKRLVIADKGKTDVFQKEQQLKGCGIDSKHIDKAKAEIASVDLLQYVDQNTAKNLNSALDSLVAAVDSELRTLLTEKYAIALLNYSITTIKSHAQRLCAKPSAPDGTGFLEFAANRISLFSACERIVKCIDGQSKADDERFGYLEDKGPIQMITEYFMFKDGDSPADYFNGKKTSLSEARKKLSLIQCKCFEVKISDKIDSLATHLNDRGIESLDDFIGVKKHTAIIDKAGTLKNYEPSDGELAIIMMDRFLSEDHDYYLLDEPERGMGNSYIDAYVRSDIVKLTDCGKTVILATHNANLAVRTFPVYSLLTDYGGKDVFLIYQGSPYSNLLVNMDDTEDSKVWTAMSMQILEGGEAAFYDRKDMYELA